jgi:Rrf2 family protein
VRISAKEDYAVRAMLELATAPDDRPVRREDLAEAQAIPGPFLENILLELKRAELVEAQRGANGGFRLARPATEITVADVVRAVAGPLATVHGARPQALDYTGSAEPLKEIWIALRANVRAVLENVTLADLASRKVSAKIKKLTDDPDAWE